MPNLFANAASNLLGDCSEDSRAADVCLLLEALDYVTVTELPAQSRTSDSETGHRALLLKAASRFARVFQLAAPDAPGLVAFGAEFDPTIADPLHAGNPLVGVSGVGLSLQEAFQGCIGEAIEYLSQLQTESDVLLSSGPADPAAKHGLHARAFLDAFSARRLRPGAELSWYPARRLTDRSEPEALLPADLCLRRAADQREIEPPFPLSNGSAAGTSWDAAALHGMLELIERDAASLWWRGGNRGGLIPALHEAHIMADALLPQLRQNVTGRRSWLLDITTDIGVPCVAAVSCNENGFGFTLGLAARPTLKGAVRSAILEMCQLELALAVVDAKRRESGEAALNARDRGHLRRATMIDADRCPLLQPVLERKQHRAFDTTDPAAVLQLIVDRLGDLGIETFGLNLTRSQLMVPVARVIAPGLQPEPSEIITPRLADMIEQTGGGMKYTGGVALI